MGPHRVPLPVQIRASSCCWRRRRGCMAGVVSSKVCMLAFQHPLSDIFEWPTVTTAGCEGSGRCRAVAGPVPFSLPKEAGFHWFLFCSHLPSTLSSAFCNTGLARLSEELNKIIQGPGRVPRPGLCRVCSCRP